MSTVFRASLVLTISFKPSVCALLLLFLWQLNVEFKVLIFVLRSTKQKKQ